MPVFENILAAVITPPSTATAVPTESATVESGGSTAPPLTTPQPVDTVGSALTQSQPVNIEAILDALGSKVSEDLDWKRSIVDLMKVVDIDSRLPERQRLARELHYSGDTDNIVAMDQWLHTAVLRKISELGSKLPSGQIDAG